MSLLRLLLLYCSRNTQNLHSFPTRRSSDLVEHPAVGDIDVDRAERGHFDGVVEVHCERGHVGERHRCDLDRKSTRLNSSHVEISYAVFCLKKKNMRASHMPS